MPLVAVVLAIVGNDDGFGADDLFWWAAGILTLLGAAAAVAALARKAWTCVHRLSELGKASNDKLDALADQVADIVAEIHPNGGGSLRDAIARTEGGVQLLRAKQEDISSDVVEMKQTQRDLRTRLDRHIDQHNRGGAQ